MCRGAMARLCPSLDCTLTHRATDVVPIVKVRCAHIVKVGSADSAVLGLRGAT